MDLGCRGSACRPGLAWLEWLRAAEAAWCWIHDLCGTQRMPLLERSKGLVIEHVSLGQATRKDTRRRCSKKAVGLALPASPFGAGGWQPGRLEEGADLAGYTSQRSVQHRLPQSRCPTLPPGTQAGSFRRKNPWHTHSVQCSRQWGLGHSGHHGSLLFITSHTQQAVNAAGPDLARCWRQWATGSLQEVGWCSASTFRRLASTLAKATGCPGQNSWSGKCSVVADLAVREPWGRPSLDEVDNVSKTILKHTAGAGTRLHQPHGYFAAASRNCKCDSSICSWHSRQSWSSPCAGHTWWCRGPSRQGGHRTIGLTVTPLRVLSWLRSASLAQKWENDHDAAYFWGCQGKVCDRTA